MSQGILVIRVWRERGNTPVEGAVTKIYEKGQDEESIWQGNTDENGLSEQVILETPPIEYSMEPHVREPYSEYDVLVEKEGYESVFVSGVQILEGEKAILPVYLIPEVIGNSAEGFVIGPNILYGDYPPKIAETEIKDVTETGEVVLSRVVIPEYIVVHDGTPRDSSAKDYYVKYKDYIKNVASSEIYATWPVETIKANVLAIMSFTLNRVYTEWYRNKGYDFTITTSTAYDHKFIPGRNIFESIEQVVDEIFNCYLARPNVKQPILTQYCDGKNVSCPNWMSQWGSKYLGDQGYSAIEILRNYYGNSMYIAVTEEISGIPSSYPGETLMVGSVGDKVRQMQHQLNVIAGAYPQIPKLVEDGIFGEKTRESVMNFQRIFGIPQTGSVDFVTWFKISEIYVGVSRIAELN